MGNRRTLHARHVYATSVVGSDQPTAHTPMTSGSRTTSPRRTLRLLLDDSAFRSRDLMQSNDKGKRGVGGIHSRDVSVPEEKLSGTPIVAETQQWPRSASKSPLVCARRAPETQIRSAARRDSLGAQPPSRARACGGIFFVARLYERQLQGAQARTADVGYGSASAGCSPFDAGIRQRLAVGL